MTTNHFRFFMFANIIIINLMSAAIYANGTLQITTEDDKSIGIPVDILKSIGTIYNIAKDFGIYDDNNKIINQEKPLEVKIVKADLFEEIIDILSAAKIILQAKEMKEKKRIIKYYDIGFADKKTLEETVDELASWILISRSPNELLALIQAANFLDASAVLHAAVKVFAKTHSARASSVHDLIDDIKRLIITELSPQEFMALIKANPQSEGTPGEEGTFKIALAFHYNEKAPPQGMSAKERYEELYKSILGQFVTIPGGTYEIGSPRTEAGRFNDENLHSVDLSPFTIMDAAVTQEAYARVIGNNPSRFKEVSYCPHSFKEIEVNGQNIPVCADYPVEMVSYIDAEKFAERMNELDPKHKYSLPTEAQLEVAFRGGTKTAYVTGRDDDQGLGAYVWYSANSKNQTHAVRSKLANKFGIYRSSVWEWAQDRYDENYAGSTGLNPQGPASGSSRVVRGGSWENPALHYLRSASRNAVRQDIRVDYIGFRLVRT